MRIVISKNNYEWISKDLIGDDCDILFDKQKLLEENGYIVRAMTPEENETLTRESAEENDFWENASDEELDAQYERNKEEIQKEKEGKTEEQLHKEFEDGQREAQGYFEFIYQVEVLLGNNPIMPQSMWEKLSEEERKNLTKE